MKQIFLHSGDAALVDDEDYEFLSLFSWSSKSRIRKADGMRMVYPRAHLGMAKYEYMHRMVLRANPGEIVDHINGNPLDNRRQNLRVVSQSENCANRGHASISKHGHSHIARVTYTQNKGKRWVRRKQWRADVTVRGVRKHIGYFFSKQEAADAAMRAKGNLL